MSAARIIRPPFRPLSGGDRSHYRKQLRAAELVYERASREAQAAYAAADAALAKAQRLACEAWSALQFMGGPDDPSPTIADALHAGCEVLEVACPHCQREQVVDLRILIWPREKPVHTVRGLLYCARCEREAGRKYRPRLLALRLRPEPDPSAPAAAAR